MIQGDKVRCMVKIARFEQSEGRDALKNCIFYKNDYVRLNLLKMVISYTAVYVIICAMVAAYYLEYLVANAVVLPYTRIFVVTGSIYLILLVVCAGISIWYYSKKYNMYQKKLSSHYENLKTMRSFYQEKEE